MPKTRIVFCKSLIIVRIPKRTISINSVILFLADEYEQTDQKLEAKVYQTLQLQVARSQLYSVLFGLHTFCGQIIESFILIFFRFGPCCPASVHVL